VQKTETLKILHVLNGKYIHDQYFSCVEVLPIKTADDVHRFADIAGWKLRMVLAAGQAHGAMVS
jgi:hypothetical protein